MSDQTSTRPSMPPLNEAERRIIIDRGTERPFTGKYWNFFERGTYVCRRCGAPLYRSESKFDSRCGWPSFDDDISGAVVRRNDPDGQRTEIICAACGAHLGHVFVGEGLTPKDTRHCANSASLVFVPAGVAGVSPANKKQGNAGETPATQKAIFAGGCFWGVEHYFEQTPGVLSVRSGYAGGKTDNPTYEQVCTGRTGHAESVEVVFNPDKVSYEQLARLFFEIHDPTELNRQGPDMGTQYRSAVFYLNDDQKRLAEKLIAQLRARGYKVVTEVVPASNFWPAEEYHQQYLQKHPGHPVCQVRVKRF